MVFGPQESSSLVCHCVSSVPVCIKLSLFVCYFQALNGAVFGAGRV